MNVSLNLCVWISGSRSWHKERLLWMLFQHLCPSGMSEVLRKEQCGVTRPYTPPAFETWSHGLFSSLSVISLMTVAKSRGSSVVTSVLKRMEDASELLTGWCFGYVGDVPMNGTWVKSRLFKPTLKEHEWAQKCFLCAAFFLPWVLLKETKLMELSGCVMLWSALRRGNGKTTLPYVPWIWAGGCFLLYTGWCLCARTLL